METDHELEGYLDEALPVEAMARIEQALRSDAALRRRLAAVIGRRDAGVHSISEIWRKHRVSCPTREQLGTYLLGAGDDEWAGYVRLHVEVVGCRTCQASLRDLESQAQPQPPDAATRRRKYFQSSAGQLRRGPTGR